VLLLGQPVASVHCVEHRLHLPSTLWAPQDRLSLLAAGLSPYCTCHHSTAPLIMRHSVKIAKADGMVKVANKWWEAWLVML
jgi:hypothetical protein